MRYIKEILKNNRIWVLAYIGLGIFNAFMANYKTDYFQKVIDGLATGKVLITISIDTDNNSMVVYSSKVVSLSGSTRSAT
jgi:hypothetical protein